MSVVAGCSLVGKVILMADTRYTYRGSGRVVRTDSVQKIFPLAPGSAIGFVGDGEVASLLILELGLQLPRRRHWDPRSLAMWIPRFFRHAFRRFSPDRRVDFLVVAVMPNLRHEVNREELLHAHFGEEARRTARQGRSIPRYIGQVLLEAPPRSRVVLPGAATMVYRMGSPDFRPIHYAPHQFAVIGSGGGARERIAEVYNNILSYPGREAGPGFEAFYLRMVLSGFIKTNNIADVGGLYPSIEIEGEFMEFSGYGHQIPGGPTIRLLWRGEDTGRWIQRNDTTGKEIPVLRPWEIAGPPVVDDLFDDLDVALGHMH